MVIKNKSGSEIILKISARCPEEDIGKNSVAACIKARNNSCIILSIFSTANLFK